MNDFTPTVPEVVDKLVALGSGEAIALFLESEGITGLPGRPMWCPIANYIRRETGCYVAACGWLIDWSDDVDKPLKAWDRITLDSPVFRDFMRGYTHSGPLLPPNWREVDDLTPDLLREYFG